MGAWTLTCPNCGFRGDNADDFGENCFGECFCPQCDERFEFEPSRDEDDDDESE